MAPEHCKEIIGKSGNHRESYLNLGSLYTRMNKMGEAVKCYEKALTIEEDHLAYFNLGCIYYKTKHYKKAVLVLDRARKFDSNFTLATLVMGLCFGRLKNYKAAESCFLNVLSRLPGNTVSLTGLAIIYYETASYKKALFVTEKIISGNASTDHIKKLRADILYKLNLLDKSAAQIKSLRTSKKELKQYDNYIKSVPKTIYSDNYGSLDEKIDCLKNRVTETNNKEELISLSLCCLLSGDIDSAIDYLFDAKKSLLN